MASKRKFALVVAAAAFAAAPAVAGEITGTGEFIDIHGESACAYNGLNDTPEGDPSVGDPGGRVQTFGVFANIFGINASDLDPQEYGPHPGYACNPQSDPQFDVF